jgi:DNA polymerase I-like protein with 3'-5' exonuclease and polymerase domains
MRHDAVGLFWQDTGKERVNRTHVRIQPPVPPSTWQPVRDLPNLSRAKVLTIDTETFDPDLLTKGPGWARGVGHLVGVAIGADDDGRWYFPLRHETLPETNYDPGRILPWLSHELGREDQSKCGANLMYDCGWLRQEGVYVRGPLWDVQFAEALLDDSALVALEVLAQKYLGESKTGSELFSWLAAYCGGKADAKQRANIHKAPACLAAPYALGDIDLPPRIMAKQWPLLEQLGLTELFFMENDLIYLLIEMRMKGITVDIPRAEQVRDLLLEKENEHTAELRNLCGFEVNVDAADSLKKVFDNFGIAYPYTDPTTCNPEGLPSFTKDFLKTVQHPVASLIRKVRSVSKTRTTFVEGYTLNAHINGKVYPQFHPLRGDSNGARTGRFSSSNPNYENAPSKDEWIGPLIRSITVPDVGHPSWRSFDYSQIQYRFLAHYAVGNGAEEVRGVFRNDPEADYHKIVQDLIKRVNGMAIERKPVKNVNFGLIFGMGIDHLAEILTLPLDEAKTLLAAYHEGAPYVKSTMDAVSKEAQLFGTVRTILGRMNRFDLWEPAYRKRGVELPALPLSEAVARYGNVRRAYTHKALNYKLQGSEGDLMKTAMLRCWKAGVFDVTGVPRNTVHDSLDFSDPGNCEDAFTEVHRIMETALTISVPIRVDTKSGLNWGECL